MSQGFIKGMNAYYAETMDKVAADVTADLEENIDDTKVVETKEEIAEETNTEKVAEEDSATKIMSALYNTYFPTEGAE